VIQMGTILEVADNSGARKIFCIKVQGGSTGDYGHIGDVITCSFKESNPDAPDPVKKGKVVKAVIVRTRMGNLQLRNLDAGNLSPQQPNNLVNVSRHDVLRRTKKLTHSRVSASRERK